ncbi:MAG: response regulator [Ignavibacteriales bacterium]|nr:response regulator [Ignavibacteriales bacterium]
MKILLLDDDERLRFNLKLFLQDEGLDCCDYTNAEDALEALANDIFNIAIVDIRLPGKNGEEFIVAAKNMVPTLHFIIHTGTANYVLPQEILDLGVSRLAVLHKPVENMHIILDAINSILP